MATPDARREPRPPYVVLDVDVTDDVVELVLLNVGQTPAHEVRVTLDPPLSALGGQVALGDLPLFRCLGLLRPDRPIRVFVDRLSALLERKPVRFRATVGWRDDDGRAHERTFEHDLQAFRGLPSLQRRP
ncbi:MAG: hypothetical protein R3E98_17235 [Gemmatimonadota bacterium]